MAIDIFLLGSLLLLLPCEVLMSSTADKNSDTPPPQWHASESRVDGGKLDEDFKEFRTFLDFKKYRTEFMAWRQSQTEEVQKFNAWLFPTSKATIPGAAVHLRKPQAAVKKRTLWSIGMTWLGRLHGLLGEHPVAVAKSLLQRRLERHRDNPIEIYPGIAISYVCDFFLILLIVVVMIAYLYEGFWGVLKIPWRILESTTLGVAHAILGDGMLESPYQRGEVQMVTGDAAPNIETDGVAAPAQMMYRKAWDELTPGQQYIIGEIQELDQNVWDNIRKQCEISKWSIPSPTVDFNDLSEYERKLLRSIGFSKRAWDLEDPDNLVIQQKIWSNLSNYEQQEAIHAGIDVPHLGPEEWDERRSPIFHMEYSKIDGKSQMHLRNIGFLPALWKPADEPKVPTKKEKLRIRYAMRYCGHHILQLVVIVQILFICWILYEIGLLAFFWDNFAVYFVLFFVILALVVNLTRYMCVMGAQRHYSTVTTHIAVIVSHSKDIWNKVQILLLFFSKMYHEQCDKCKAGVGVLCGGEPRTGRTHGPRNLCFCCKPATIAQRFHIGL